jgi:hypothetical protein
MTRPIVLLALAVLTLGAAATGMTARAEGYCKAGDHYDEAKGLCYPPAAAYRPDVPKGDTPTGSWLPSLGGITSGIAGKAVFCNYGDRLVGSGDQAYCVSKTTNKPYPAGR